MVLSFELLLDFLTAFVELVSRTTKFADAKFPIKKNLADKREKLQRFQISLHPVKLPLRFTLQFWQEAIEVRVLETLVLVCWQLSQ